MYNFAREVLEKSLLLQRSLEPAWPACNRDRGAGVGIMRVPRASGGAATGTIMSVLPVAAESCLDRGFADGIEFGRGRGADFGPVCGPLVLR